MSVSIRLKRAGARHRPFFKVVVTDSRMPRDGRFIATLGIYDPLAESGNVKIDVEQAKEWMDKGAKPSVTVTHLLRRAGMVPPKPEVAKAPAEAVSLDDLRSPEAVASGEPETVEAADGGGAKEKPARKKSAPKKAARSAKRTAKKKSE